MSNNIETPPANNTETLVMEETLPMEQSLELSLDEVLMKAEKETQVAKLSADSMDSFFDFLGLDLTKDAYKNLNITEKKATKIKNSLISMKHGTYASVPLVCSGPNKCPIIHQCWFHNPLPNGQNNPEDVFPLFEPCPVEASMLKIRIQQYMGEIFEANQKLTITIKALITKLAELDIYETRCNAILSKGLQSDPTDSSSPMEGTNLLSVTVEGINQTTGEMIRGWKEHPVLAIKDRIQKQRDKIWSQLIADPLSKMNMKARFKDEEAKTDMGSILAGMAAKIQQLEYQSQSIEVLPQETVELKTQQE